MFAAAFFDEMTKQAKEHPTLGDHIRNLGTEETEHLPAKHRLSAIRMLGRGLVHGFLGAAVGGLAAHTVSRGNPDAEAGAAFTGAVLGHMHGRHVSAKNQVRERGIKAKLHPGRALGRSLVYGVASGPAGGIASVFGQKHSYENQIREQTREDKKK